MADQNEPGIRITKEEVAEEWIDQVLEQVAAADSQRRQLPDTRTGLFYRSWFLLALVGALAALAAWAILEPLFTPKSNQFSFKGELISVYPMAVLPGNPVKGKLLANNIRVWLPEEGIDPFVFYPGQQVEVTGNIYYPVPNTIFASQVVILEGETSEKADIVLPVEADTSQNDLKINTGVVMLMAGLIGLAIGSADGLITRAMRRAVWCGFVGLLVGLGLGGVIGYIANLLYTNIQFNVVGEQTDLSQLGFAQFMILVFTRGMLWALAGIAMGLGQGVALRSRVLAVNGVIGGALGGLVGGLLFDPLSYLVGGGTITSGATTSRLVGFMIVGIAIGFFIGIVELFARDAWLKMLAGPARGKEYILYRNPMRIGSSSKSDLPLPGQPEIESVHALIRRVGEHYEIEDQHSTSGLFVNGQRVARKRLVNGDQLHIGQVVFSFNIASGHRPQ